MRCQAAASRSAQYPQAGLGHLAHFRFGARSLGALWCQKALRQYGQYVEVPRAGTMTTAMPYRAAR
jgi:hypothetical protein